MKYIIPIIICLLIIPSTFAIHKEGHMTILAVQEVSEGNFVGNKADLYLEIKSGSGRVFIDTFPLTKIDTQMSTRFAKEIACDYIDIDCSNLDFIYTIRAESPIVGGPSAGAAISVLTASLLMDTEIDETISITGTINSGGLIGPVGSIKNKIDAAKKAGLKKVLIPEGERFYDDKNLKEISAQIKIIPIVSGTLNITDTIPTNISIEETENNITVDLVEYGKEIGIEVKEVSTLDEVLYEFMGITIKKPSEKLEISDDYTKTMKFLADDLCKRSQLLTSQIKEINMSNNSSISNAKKSALNQTNKGLALYNDSIFYSSASYCFGSNVQLSYLVLLSKNLSINETKKKIDLIDSEIRKVEQLVDKKDKKTITDLEAYMVVKERLKEAKELLSDANSSENLNDSLYNLAYSTERLKSALSWSKFFDTPGKEFQLSEEKLKQTCKTKLAEAEERYQYTSLITLLPLEKTKKEIDYAYDDLKNDDFELCIFKASKAKAEVGVILDALGVKIDKVENLLDKKLEIAKQSIIKEEQKDIFPILAYSYYEYGKELADSDVFSALLYSSYALELSNLDLYLKEKQKININIDYKSILIFIYGLIVGIIITLIVKRNKKTRKKKHKKPRRTPGGALLGKKR